MTPEENTVTAWCTQCGVRLTHEELVEHGQPNCPKCGYDGVPCDPANDVTVRLNWHELRILTIFAMNHAQTLEKVTPRGTVTAICRRLEKQHPDQLPLTLVGELKQVAELPYVSDMEIHGMPDFDEFVEVNGPGAVTE